MGCFFVSHRFIYGSTSGTIPGVVENLPASVFCIHRYNDR